MEKTTIFYNILSRLESDFDISDSILYLNWKLGVEISTFQAIMKIIIHFLFHRTKRKKIVITKLAATVNC